MNRVRTFYAETLTGWDWFWWTVFPAFEVRRIARKVLNAQGGKLDPDIDERFVTPDGDVWLITSNDAEVKPDERPVRQF
jgi:hypothetical protein